MSLVAVAAIALDARRAVEDTTQELRAAETRVAALEDQVASQSVDVAATETAMRVLANDVRAVSDEIVVQPDIPGVTRKVLESVFTVETADGSGSSFVVSSSDGISRLVTNAHVVSRVWNNGGRGVELVQGDRRLSATITEMSFSNDLALLSVHADLPALSLTEKRADPGSPVLVVGSPLGLEGSVVSGVVSSYRVEEGQEHLQLSAPINPGNSGGPVTTSDGSVVGVVVAKFVGFEIEGLSFAVPTDVLCKTFDVC